MMSTRPNYRTHVWRSTPYSKESPRKVIHRGPAIYVRPDGTQFQRYTKREHPAKTKTIPREDVKPKENRKEFSDHLTKCFLDLKVDLRDSTKIGGGRYSKVYTANMIEEGTQRKIAMKIINEEQQSIDFVKKFLPREIDCWKRLDHPHVVTLLGHYSGNNHTYLTMELAEQKDLLNWVQQKGALSERRGKLWTTQIIQGLGYMHKMGIAHRDLKLENIMVFNEKTVKIGDFGFAKTVGCDLSNTHCGSKSYSAPEVLGGQPYNPYKSDTWAVGIIIFIMMSNRMPFNENQPHFKILEIQRYGKFNYPELPVMSEECRDILKKMLQFYPENRPRRIMEVLGYPWFERDKSVQCVLQREAPNKRC